MHRDLLRATAGGKESGPKPADYVAYQEHGRLPTRSALRGLKSTCGLIQGWRGPNWPASCTSGQLLL